MKSYWRSENQLNNTEEYKQFLHREFQEDASVLEDEVSRRSFLKLMGASAALAGVSGCSLRKPSQKIRPYAKMPEYIKPGKSVYYATSMAIGNDVAGLLAKTNQGRPTKLEGNPEYVGSNGKTNSFQQASILNLYDPDRLREIEKSGVVETKLEFEQVIKRLSEKYSKNGGQGFSILAESSVSPVFYSQLKALKRKFPNSVLHRYEPINSDNSLEGVRKITGAALVPDYYFKKANVVVSLGADFLSGQNGVKYSLDYAFRRDPENSLSRSYVFESHYTSTGAKADHRYAVGNSEIAGVLLSLIKELHKRGSIRLDASIQQLVKNASSHSVQSIVFKAIADDLLKNKGKSVVVVGEQQDAFVHSLAYILNKELNNIGSTIEYRVNGFQNEEINSLNNLDSITALANDIRKKKVDTLLILGANPVYNAPVELSFEKLIESVPNTICLTLKKNETSQLCDWVVPRSHYLESWDSLRDLVGIDLIQQPVIKPMYTSYSENELLSLFLGGFKSGYVLLRQYWKEKKSWNFDESWKTWLHNGLITNTPDESLVKSYTVNSWLMSQIKANLSNKESNGLELNFIKDYSVYDGRFTNNSWLQEMPDPVTKLTWDNALLVSPKTARDLGLKSQDLVKIKHNDNELDAAVMVSPGAANKSLALALGYGRSVVGRVGENTGFNAYKLRTVKDGYVARNVTLIKLNEQYALASTQDHGSMEGRPLYRSATLADYKKNPDFASDMGEPVPETPPSSAYSDIKYTEGYQWGMVIDLGKCTGCNACVVSCQSENNIPIVGKTEVLNGREMHWIRVDRYYEGDIENPDVVNQPVTCLQCENAPCEQVCPVAATVHDDEGLNAMVYNRCVGTRYCADNCPTKVRRFNFFDYHQKNPQSKPKDRVHFFDYFREPEKALQMQFNQDVTVRMRGVMEKCTFCVQRLTEAKITAKNSGRVLNDGEVQTACQQACPSEAIVFGNILDKQSTVYKLKNSNRNYSILEQLLLQARTTYIAEVLNPNPLLASWSNKSKKKEHV